MKEKPGKILKKISKEREKEWMPSTDPERPYRRTMIKTRFSWPMHLLYEGRWDVLVVVIIIVCLFGIVAVIGLYFLVGFLIKIFGGLIP